jgi:serine/threonine-protein kinase
VAAVGAVALVLLAAVLFGVLHGSGSSAGPSPTTSPAPSGTAAPTTTATPTPTTPPSVQLDAARFTGRPVAAVQQELASMGLPVVVKAVAAPGVTAGTVVGIDPSGSVPAGATVTVSYAAPSAPEKPGGGKVPPGHRKHGGD